MKPEMGNSAADALGSQLEHARCPLCDEDDFRVLFRRPDLTHLVSPFAFPVVRCRRCSMVYVTPRPAEQALEQFYPDPFFAAEAELGEFLTDQGPFLLEKWKYVKDLRPGRLLDIGCQKGEFLYFMEHRGWKVKGVELFPKAPNRFHQDIFYGRLEQAAFPPAEFDLITLWAVLEHVYSPKKLLRLIRPLLAPGGVLVVLVPNFFSIPGRIMRHDDIPRHTSLFTAGTLGRMLTATGFTVQDVDYNHVLFGGGTRGIFNYLAKRFAGERFDEIVRQNRTPGRWIEFALECCRQPCPTMADIDLWDQQLSPWLSGLMDILGMGFTMIVRARSRRAAPAAGRG